MVGLSSTPRAQRLAPLPPADICPQLQQPSPCPLAPYLACMPDTQVGQQRADGWLAYYPALLPAPLTLRLPRPSMPALPAPAALTFILPWLDLARLLHRHMAHTPCPRTFTGMCHIARPLPATPNPAHACPAYHLARLPSLPHCATPLCPSPQRCHLWTTPLLPFLFPDYAMVDPSRCPHMAGSRTYSNAFIAFTSGWLLRSYCRLRIAAGGCIATAPAFQRCLPLLLAGFTSRDGLGAVLRLLPLPPLPLAAAFPMLPNAPCPTLPCCQRLAPYCLPYSLTCRTWILPPPCLLPAAPNPSACLAVGPCPQCPPLPTYLCLPGGCPSCPVIVVWMGRWGWVLPVSRANLPQHLAALAPTQVVGGGWFLTPLPPPRASLTHPLAFLALHLALPRLPS